VSSIPLDLARSIRIWLRNNKPGRRYVKTPYGVRLRANHSDWIFKFAVEARDGFLYSQFLASIAEPFTFLDIGANQGLYPWWRLKILPAVSA
jgi:hypothetical protein